MKDSEMHALIIGLVILVLIIQIMSLMQISNLTSGGSGKLGNTTIQKVGYVTITATGSASAQPTTGTLYVNAQGKGITAAGATANLSIALAQMNSSISKYINGNQSRIKTTYYNIYNQSGNYNYPYGYNTYNGFVASEQLTITIPNTQNVSGAIGALSLINNLQISSASSTLSDSQITALRSTAFSNARQNATTQASILTNNASLSIQNITVNSYYFYPIAYALGSAGSVKGTNANTTTGPGFYSGLDSVTESVTIVFSYNKK